MAMRTRGQKRGIALNSASTTVVGSYISDIKSKTQDAQAIAGWSGPGPFLIENNYLEASGENFMLGGATPASSGLIPSDVVFRKNHVTRPAAWRDQGWVVKNLFELKNARRVLVEANLFETHWAGAQPGYAIVLTPRGERGAAPWAVVEDVTFRYNVIRNVAAVFNLLARDDAGPSGSAQRIRIADNLIHGVDRQVWGGNGTFLQVGEGPSELIVEHNTIIQTGNIITAYGGSTDRSGQGGALRLPQQHRTAQRQRRHRAELRDRQRLDRRVLPGRDVRPERSRRWPRQPLSVRQPVSRSRSLRAAVRELRRA